MVGEGRWCGLSNPYGNGQSRQKTFCEGGGRYSQLRSLSALGETRLVRKCMEKYWAVKSGREVPGVFGIVRRARIGIVSLV